MSKERFCIDLPDLDLVIEVFYTENPNMFEKGLGYVHDGYVYIYDGKLRKKGAKPGCVYVKGGKAYWIQHEEEHREMFSVERIVPLNNDAIYKEIEERANLKEVDPVLIESSTDYFAPEVVEGDDSLKIIVKNILKNKEIAIRPAKDCENPYDITNMKANLMKASARMSMGYFQRWLSMLDAEATIIVKFRDKDDKPCVYEQIL